ncbi:Arc family DNA-binding protein [Pantoea allii]|uniref:Arc-like DNA binding dprotein n=1 Tax=Pantoea allii TaxID=574096 RepID=A0A2V2BBF5_9GAMM|nr:MULTISPECIES: Arc family DNA-binding protein [Pantoea]MBW1254510.1 Arc family DNA-binding protein [Pantoea allii]MBW1263513.1 Arc family DNA-binding protein [Pantoea allii]MBW1285706.1 Arc family DNA-binding protein [Pantoea allii]MDJ0037868.1 Arc family DNA-binding protein [Pantoea allii]MDJ0038752.1 Arc family DNA-binding protein [Pantoea allii]
MTETVNLTIKIDPALKEHIKQLALENQVSMSQEIVQRLQASLNAPSQPIIDSQNTEEEASDALNSSEIKQLRTLLKKQSKKKK